MGETISNDYVSMINKRGSGYNIPVIVDAIVDAAIAPAKEIVTAKKEKVDAMISGMAALKSSAKISETTIKGLSSSTHHAVSQSPDSRFMETSIADATKVTASSHTISHIVLAKPMVYRVDNAGAASSSTVNQTITIEFGNNTTSNNFTASSPARSHEVVLSGKSLAGLVQELNNVAGINVELVQLNSNSTNTSVIFTSETGSTNGFRISSSVSDSRWQTANAGAGSITQASTDASFKLNGQDFVRSSNTVTDIIPGLQVKLLANTADVQSINVKKSKT
jgi:flagellar hook-associated protein 2